MDAGTLASRSDPITMADPALCLLPSWVDVGVLLRPRMSARAMICRALESSRRMVENHLCLNLTTLRKMRVDQVQEGLQVNPLSKDPLPQGTMVSSAVGHRTTNCPCANDLMKSVDHVSICHGNCDPSRRASTSVALVIDEAAFAFDDPDHPTKIVGR